MIDLIDTALGDRSYLNGGQLLHALPVAPGFNRVRVRFRRLTTHPGFWSTEPDERLEETCRATLMGEWVTRTFYFLTKPDLPLMRGAGEPLCHVKVVSLIRGPLVPERSEADFEGAVWNSTILLSKMIGPPPDSNATWLPVFVEGGSALLSPTPQSGRILLTYLRERAGVQCFRIEINGEKLMTFGVVIAKIN